MLGATIAKNGYKEEEKLKNFLNDNHDATFKLLNYSDNSYENFNVKFNKNFNYLVKRTARNKDDLTIEYQTNKENKKCYISLKSSQSNYNQILRVNIDNFVNKFDYNNKKIISNIEKSFINKAYNSKNFAFNSESLEFFNSYKKDILEYILFADNVNLLIINNIQNKQYNVFKKEIILNYLNGYSFTLNNNGNIKLSNLITIQKKGGDSNKKKYLKTDIRHPSNNLQFKLCPLYLIQECESLIIKS